MVAGDKWGNFVILHFALPPVAYLAGSLFEQTDPLAETLRVEPPPLPVSTGDLECHTPQAAAVRGLQWPL